jgi:OOP family OmpA-OmpF porin
MIRKPIASFVALLLLLKVVGAASQAATQNDHPLLSRYVGSVLNDKKIETFAEYKLVTGLTPKGEFVGEKIKGKVTRIVYQNPKDRSTLEIFKNYQQALAAAGAATLFTCELNDCGPAFSRSAWGRYNGLFTAADGDPRYLAGKVTTRNATAYVALMVGRQRSQLDVIEVVAMQGDMVVADAAVLAQGIDRDGKISVYGIYFDTDKADIKPESKPALDEIAKLLKSRADLKLFVVGHTDITGALAHNRALSEARARAVVKTLVGDYKIDAARLEGYGVGPLAPTAPNASDDGRAKNRRVELVAR